MAKRLTDTDKWKKPFIRGLEGPYKLLWLYILDDCDHAGIWQVDFEVARIRIGVQVDYHSAIGAFKDRIQVIDKFKWFIPDFIEFQYGNLTESNRMHVSVINILRKYNLYDKGVTSPLQGAINKDKVKDKDKDKRKDKDIAEISVYSDWTNSILSNNDSTFEQMLYNERWSKIPASVAEHWIKDHLDLLHRYPKMRPADQQSFRHSVIKHLRENKDKQINGNIRNHQKNTGGVGTKHFSGDYKESL